MTSEDPSSQPLQEGKSHSVLNAWTASHFGQGRASHKATKTACWGGSL